MIADDALLSVIPERHTDLLYGDLPETLEQRLFSRRLEDNAVLTLGESPEMIYIELSLFRYSENLSAPQRS